MIGSNVPGIAENEILMFSGFYEDYITFQTFEDLSGNEMRNSDVTLDVNVTDSVAPIVTLRGGDPLYVDLNATISGTRLLWIRGFKLWRIYLFMNWGNHSSVNGWVCHMGLCR